MATEREKNTNKHKKRRKEESKRMGVKKSREMRRMILSLLRIEAENENE
jgi:hypothetical protein